MFILYIDQRPDHFPSDPQIVDKILKQFNGFRILSSFQRD
ncbi:hypothetical protein B4144_0326 [Bacillus atrophaeus]|nr:hypothetical protein B4144_0326 [Bacillus atrophaeus]